MARTKTAHAEIQAVRDEYQRIRERIERDLADSRITDAVAAEQRAAAREALTARLNAARGVIDEYLASATTAVDKARRAALAGPGGLEGELAASRTWARYQRVYDALSDPAAWAKATADLDRAPAADLAVLAQELGPYLEARGHRRSEIDEEIITALDAAIDTPEYNGAREYLQHAERVAGVLRMNASRVEQVIEYDPVASPEVAQPLGYGDLDALRFATEVDPTVDRAPIVPGATVDGAGSVWDPHEQEFVAPEEAAV